MKINNHSENAAYPLSIGAYQEIPNTNGLYFLHQLDGMLYRKREKAIFTLDGWQKSVRFNLVMPHPNGRGLKATISIDGKKKTVNLAKLQAQILRK